MKDKLFNMAMDIRGNPHERISALDRLIERGWIGGVSKEEYDKIAKQLREVAHKYTFLNMEYYDVLERMKDMSDKNDKLTKKIHYLEQEIKNKKELEDRVAYERSKHIVSLIAIALIVLFLLVISL